MVIDGGGWTLVGSFVFDDNIHSWTQWKAETDNLGVWRNDGVFGTLGSYQGSDYKSRAFSSVSADDLLAMDDTGNWARFSGVVESKTLLQRISNVSTCTTEPVLPPGSALIAASQPAAIPSLMLGFYGADPNQQLTCAFNNFDIRTDSSVIYMVAEECGAQGFGHLGWFDESTDNNNDRDSTFCLSEVPTSAIPLCGSYFATGVSSRWGCKTNASFLFVR